MKEFIDSFGLNNFIIIIAVVVAIVLALLIIFVLEKISKRRNKSILDYYDDFTSDDDDNEEKDSIDFDNGTITNEVIDEVEEVTHVPGEVVYQDDITQQEAKKTLAEVTKKLIEEEPSVIDHTHFEKEQEERSVISYEELKKINYNIDEENDNVLSDEDDLPITIEELYKKHLDEQETNEDVLDNPVFVEPEEEIKKFKNSEVISPVFGIYNKNLVKDSKKNVKPNDSSSVEMQDLELEIKKTEDFLKELKKLKDKLD